MEFLFVLSFSDQEFTVFFPSVQNLTAGSGEEIPTLSKLS